MYIEEKIELIDKVLHGLKTSKHLTVPELIDGFQKFPFPNSDNDLRFRTIENELITLKLAKKIGGGDNSTIGGYIEFRLSPIGIELIESKKSVRELYDEIENKKSLDSKTKEFSLEKLQYEKSNREQEQKIRDLTEKLSFLSLMQKYWWVLTIACGLGILIAKLIQIVFL